MKKLATNKVFVICAAIFCCALWGISTPLVKIGYNYIDASHVPSLLLWIGLLFIVSGFLTICFYSGISKKVAFPQKGSMNGIVIVSILQTVLQYALLYIGLSQTTSVKGAILKGTDVFFVVLVASFVFKSEKLTAKKLCACVIGFLGIIVMNLNGLTFNSNPIGDGLVLLAVISYAFSVSVTKIFAQKENPIILCGYQMGFGGIILLLIGAVSHGRFDFIGMLPIFICLVLIYAVSYTLWTILLKYNPASSVSIYSFMIPVFGVLFSALLLSEDGGVARTNLIIALILVCLGIILWGYEKKASIEKTK